MRFKNPTGFTLIEILIVMLIISIVGGITLLTINHNQNTQLSSYSNELTNRLMLAEQQAILAPATLGLTITDSKLKFYIYREETKTFVLSNQSSLGIHRIPKNIHITLKLKHENTDNNSDEPHIIFSNSGEVTAFSLLIGSSDKSPLYEIKVDPNGNIKNNKINPTQLSDKS